MVMGEQTGLSSLSDELAQVRTMKNSFDEDGSHHTVERVGQDRAAVLLQRRARNLEPMLRLYVLQNLYDLSDEGTVAEAMDSRAASDFGGVECSNQCMALWL